MKRSLIAALATMTLFGSIAAKNVAAAEDTRHSGIYQFEHRLLPNWVHHSDGAFFMDLQEGIPEQMRDQAEEIVDKAFAEALKLKSYPSESAYVVIFPEPAECPECYFAIIKKEVNGFSYYTLEKGLDIFGTGKSTVLCQWTKDGGHANLGPREYNDLESFVNEIIFKKTEQ